MTERDRSRDDGGSALQASVLIVEYASRGAVAGCLAALEASTLPRERFEVILVDNASPTPVADLAQRFPRVRVLTSNRNLGFAGGNQLALRHASGRHVVMLNPDTVPCPDWLPELLAPLDEPDIGIVGCKLLYPHSTVLQHAGGALSANALSRHIGRGELDRGQYDTLRDVEYVCGAAMAVRRDVIERVGFLSPCYFPAYYEETELCIRARRAGFRVVYAPKAVVEHLEGHSAGGRTSTTLRHYHENRVRFVLRNSSRRELMRRFAPAELMHLALGCDARERRICLRAHWAAWKSHFRPRPRVEEADSLVDDSWESQ